MMMVARDEEFTRKAAENVIKEFTIRAKIKDETISRMTSNSNPEVKIEMHKRAAQDHLIVLHATRLLLRDDTLTSSSYDVHLKALGLKPDEKELAKTDRETKMKLQRIQRRSEALHTMTRERAAGLIRNEIARIKQMGL